MEVAFASSTQALVLAALWLPAAAFAVIMLVGRSRPRLSATLSILAVSVSAISAVVLLAGNWRIEEPIRYAARWISSGGIVVPYGFLLDPVSLLMFTVVSWICLIVQVYSIGYMAGDPGFARYYGYMSLFVWAMLSLTISPSLIQLYIFWELVGLASYLLIGFWYEKFSASEAGKKAFVMTRLGDVSFFIGMLLILTHVGDLDILALNGSVPAEGMSPMLTTAAAVLIFGGIVGKSAQFPLMTWLPDAMEGPTPVSALLHSATMVAAGVYLFARLFPFFSLSPTAMTIFLAIGTISMVAASTMALVSHDIKRVWAYSTVSQLGYMIMGLAAGGYAAGVLHLTTHAVFKALLFLCAGVFIHHFETNDMVAIGRSGGRRMRIPMVCMILGGAALSGIPPMSGFFSKEMIMGALATVDNPLWMVAGFAGVFLTTYYTFRLILIILFPRRTERQKADEASHPEAVHGDNRSYRVMVVPLIVLAAASLLLGVCMAPLVGFLGRTGGPAPGGGADHHTAILVVSLTLEVLALALAWFEFGRQGASQKGFAERRPAVRDFFEQRWYIDRFYRFALDTFIYRGIAALCLNNDQRIIDGGIDGFSLETIRTGGWLARMHAAMIQYRLLVIFAMMTLLGVYVLL